ncbi:MAG: hypothetical protein QXT49_01565 [Candidatus Nezhaarchaeales archaeon]
MVMRARGDKRALNKNFSLNPEEGWLTSRSLSVKGLLKPSSLTIFKGRCRAPYLAYRLSTKSLQNS